MRNILIIEPFYGGSHKQLIDFLQTLPHKFELVTLTAKKWHWRARTSALYLSQKVPKDQNFDVLFCSSVLNLCELLSLRPDLAKIPRKIVYFHENQLCYPVQDSKNRDFQYGYNQILTCQVADLVLFNSKFNLDSFLDKLGPFFKTQPDFRPDMSLVKNEILKKSKVLYFPVNLPKFKVKSEEILHILWPHRWEHDKNPEAFFEILFRLNEENENFKVSILGENFQEIPEVFQTAKEKLGDKICHFGYLPSKEDYKKVLEDSIVVVSTSNHEFFGVAMIEAASAGNLPLVPNRLVYPEIYPKDPCVYNTDNQLYKRLKNLCQKPYLASKMWTEELALKTCDRFSYQNLYEDYLQIFE